MSILRRFFRKDTPSNHDDGWVPIRDNRPVVGVWFEVDPENHPGMIRKATKPFADAASNLGRTAYAALTTPYTPQQPKVVADLDYLVSAGKPDRESELVGQGSKSLPLSLTSGEIYLVSLSRENITKENSLIIGTERALHSHGIIDFAVDSNRICMVNCLTGEITDLYGCKTFGRDNFGGNDNRISREAIGIDISTIRTYAEVFCRSSNHGITIRTFSPNYMTR